jgi:transcriptional regulator with XRE-family HTH domain
MTMRDKEYSTDNPHPVDIHVGRRLRSQRMLKGLSQEKLADSLGITFQQVQKYENGTNRLSASRLFLVSQALDIGLGYFFEGITGQVESQPLQVAEKKADMSDAGSLLNSRESIELMRAYQQIQDPAARKQLVEIARNLAKAYTVKK